ncbi:hypothetical protein C9374_009825 [Naegleria lovaniensis]|uniref:RGS domain-containing protein n=1 Tax=Naegleria lovaniensis TaxID=51637 RepID=A0AA88KPK1_NAELO|nr:uncharacterized protein C9374_009825 [Naegleria lovaniensis]KAG2393248.1 hypothetical protein C9374_009825 [Naegleria lovaniensis]
MASFYGSSTNSTPLGNNNVIRKDDSLQWSINSFTLSTLLSQMNVTCGNPNATNTSSTTQTPTPYHQPSSSIFNSYINKHSSHSVSLSSFTSVMDADAFAFSFHTTHHLHNNNNTLQKSPIAHSSNHHQQQQHHRSSSSGSLLLPEIKYPTPLSQLSLSFTILLIVIQDIQNDEDDNARDSQTSSNQYNTHIKLLEMITERQKSLRQLGVLPVVVFSDKSSEEEFVSKLKSSSSHLLRIIDEQYELTKQLMELVWEEQNLISNSNLHQLQQLNQFLHPQQAAQNSYRSTTSPRKGHQSFSKSQISSLESPNKTANSMNLCSNSHTNIGKHSKLLPKMFLIRENKLVFHWDESTIMEQDNVMGSVLSTIVLKLPQCTMSTEDIVADENACSTGMNGHHLNSRSSSASSEKMSPSTSSSSHIVVPTGMSLQDAFGVLTGRCSARSYSNGSASGGHLSGDGGENNLLRAIVGSGDKGNVFTDMDDRHHHEDVEPFHEEDSFVATVTQTENASETMTNPVTTSHFAMFNQSDLPHPSQEKSPNKHQESSLTCSEGTNFLTSPQSNTIQSPSHINTDMKSHSNSSIVSSSLTHGTPLLGNSTTTDKSSQLHNLSTSTLSVVIVDSNSSSSTLISGTQTSDMTSSQQHCIPNTSSLSLNTDHTATSPTGTTPTVTSAEHLMQRKRFSLFRKLREKFEIEKIALEQQRLEREMQIQKSEKKKQERNKERTSSNSVTSKRSIFALCFGFTKENIDEETSPLSRPTQHDEKSLGNVDSYDQSISEMFQIMHDDMKRQYFKLYSLKQFNAENLLFYEDVKLFYKKIVSELKRPYMIPTTNVSMSTPHDTPPNTATSGQSSPTMTSLLYGSTSTAPSSNKSKLSSIGFSSKSKQQPSTHSSPSHHSKSLSSTSIIETSSKSRSHRRDASPPSLETSLHSSTNPLQTFTLPKNSELVQDLYEKIFRMAEYISLKYLLDPESVYCLNTSNKLVEQVKQNMQLSCWDFIDQADHLFDEVVSELVKSVLPDMFFRFVVSSEYWEMQQALEMSSLNDPSSSTATTYGMGAQAHSPLRTNGGHLSKLNISGLNINNNNLSEEFNNNLAANCYYSPRGRISPRPSISGYFQ